VEYIEGIGGWRFLENDSNRSVDQYTGKRLLSDEELSDWNNFLSLESIKETIFLIAPAKEEIVPFLYPHQRADLTPIDQLLQLPSASSVIYPIDELKESWNTSYSPLDTHWTDQGACLAAGIIANRLGTPTDALNNLSYVPRNYEGDLGNKSTPKRTGSSFFLKDNPRASNLVFDNGIPNHGRVWIFENKNAPINRKVAIFGDSFSINMASVLSLIYRRVFYAHTAAQPDMNVISLEKPDHIILQTNQRFITTPPSANTDIINIAKNKLSLFNREECLALKARIIERDNSTATLHLGKAIRNLHDLRQS